MARWLSAVDTDPICIRISVGLAAEVSVEPLVLAVSGNQLASVHALLSAERRVAEYDILLATCMERFRQGPATSDDLFAHCQATWPGAAIDKTQLEAAIDTAVAAGYIAKQQSLDTSESAWTLTGLGATDLQTSALWASDSLARTRSELRRRVQVSFRDISDTEAELWLDQLWGALCAGIQAAYGIYQGEVTALIDHQSVIPRSFDVERITDEISQVQGITADVADVLGGLALAALDPSDTFGNELVTHISTGYLLHSFLSRRDMPEARRQVGSLRDVRIVIDTPWLHSSLGSSRDRTTFEEAVRASLSSGAEVVVFEHSLGELADVAERLSEEDYPTLQVDIDRGVDLSLLTAVFENHSLQPFLLALRDGEVADWADYRSQVETLETRLIAIGVTVRRHFNEGCEDEVEEAITALNQALEAAGSGRSKRAIDRDGHTMTAARRWRDKGQYVGRGIWPASFVVTTDQSMGPAYSSLNPNDERTLTLTPSQWMGVVASCAKPADATKLASAATDLLARESVMAVAVKWPPEMAIGIARSLDPEASLTPTDIRIGQLTLEDVLADQPDVVGDPVGSGEMFAAALVAQRNRRIEQVHQDRAERLGTAERSQREQVNALTAARAAERDSRLEAEMEASRLRTKVEQTEADLNKERILGKRRTILSVLLALGVALAVAFAFAQMWFLLGGMVVSLGILWERSIDWLKDIERDWRRLLVAPLAEAVGLVLQLLASS